MATVVVDFRYLTGLKRDIFREARLQGSWDGNGRFSPGWSEIPMASMVAEDGCPAFTATAQFDQSEIGKTFQWSVRLSTPRVADVSGIPTEVNDGSSTDRVRGFRLRAGASTRQVEEYYFTYARRLGARKIFPPDGTGEAGLRFALWAPNAQSAEVVFGNPASGYIADDGDGIDPTRQPLLMTRDDNGIWQTPIIADFASFDGLPYMYR